MRFAKKSDQSEKGKERRGGSRRKGRRKRSSLKRAVEEKKKTTTTLPSPTLTHPPVSLYDGSFSAILMRTSCTHLPILQSLAWTLSGDSSDESGEKPENWRPREAK
jgi:hypothetical protein